MKKIVGIVVLLLMTLVLNVSTTKVEAAQSENTGTITIKNDPAVTGIELDETKTFSAYKVFDLEVVSGNGVQTEATHKYTVDEQFKMFFEQKAAEVGETVNTPEKLNDFAYNYVNQKDKLTTIAKELNYYVRAQKVGADGVSGAVYKDEKSIQSTEISGLLLGYYLVLDNQIPDNEDPNDNTVVAAASLGSADNHLEITLKASKPTVDKEIQHNENGEWGNVGDNQIGDVVKYRLTSTLPTSVIGYDSYTYKLHDTLSAGLTFNKDVVIKVRHNDNTETIVDKAYYTVTLNDDQQSFSIDVDVLKGLTDTVFKLGEKLIVEYSATLNENAVVAGDSNDNEVYLEYSNNPSDENSKDKTPTVTVKDYTFKLNVLKTQGDASTALAGAVFKLFEGETPLKFKVTTIEDDHNQVINKYTVCGNQELSKACTEEMISPTNGKFAIVGLDDATEYTLKEVQAPTGFIPMKPITFTITAEYNEDGTPKSISTNVGGITQEGEGNFELGTTVVNMPGIELPETGGIGTVIFKVLGAALMVSGVLLVIYKRRLN